MLYTVLYNFIFLILQILINQLSAKNLYWLSMEAQQVYNVMQMGPNQLNFTGNEVEKWFLNHQD